MALPLTILPMDTGSGKTLIAALRVEQELQRCSANKRVWFLCPTVVLAEQQRNALSRSLSPAFTTRLISGNDGVDHWSSRDVWYRVLEGISVVVCTYQVLLDALNFSFVLLDEIALLVIDEAHHCHGKHPLNRIMLGHYHTAVKASKHVPQILGLTASPVQSTKKGSLDATEANLNAISRTPKDFREELLRHVHIPELIVVLYSSVEEPSISLLTSLKTIKNTMAMRTTEDPWVKLLQRRHGSHDLQRLDEALNKGKTWCQEHIGRLCTVSEDLYQELGLWAIAQYLHTCVTGILQRRNVDMLEEEIRQTELEYLCGYLAQLDISRAILPSLTDQDAISLKLDMLIRVIVNEWTPGTRAIIFVKTRNGVQLLSEILSKHEHTRDLLKIGTFVGLSAFPARGSRLTELIDSKDQKDTLDHLRSGKNNLLISTSVCEEGIDVSACNLVICYEAPANLRAFIQRRGRARSSSSKYVIMLPEEKMELLQKWHEAEEYMKQQCMDDLRLVKELEQLESDEEGYRELMTAQHAKLTLETATPLLHHFCAKIPKIPYVTQEPIYTYTQDDGSELQRCSVLLPGGVEPSISLHHSASSWISQRLARKDAAFEAVSALYNSGLINEHLMPVSPVDAELSSTEEGPEGRPNVVPVEAQFNPWSAIAQSWASADTLYAHQLSISVSDGRVFKLSLLAPLQLPTLPTTQLFIDRDTTAQVHYTTTEVHHMDSDILEKGRKATQLLLRAAMPSRVHDSKLDFTVLCVPADFDDDDKWLKDVEGTARASTLLHSQPNDTTGLLRDTTKYGAPFFYLGTDMVAQESGSLDEQKCHSREDMVGSFDENDSIRDHQAAEGKPLLRVRKFPKRMDFTHRIDASAIVPSKRHEYVDPDNCTVDRLPSKWATLARWIPSVFHTFNNQLVVRHLCSELLRDIPLNPAHALTAISAGSARNTSNYQRLEFLGDSLLYTSTSLHLVASHPLWHEGYLSRAKDHQVSNRTLSRECQARSLASYILTEPFMGTKWRPMYNSDFDQQMQTGEEGLNKTRELSTKILADVVESVLGAAWASAGEAALVKCLLKLLPQKEWKHCTAYLEALQETDARNHPDSQSHVPEQYLKRLTRIISYEFNRPAILQEALTHPSYIAGLTSTPSYQRLEFLGDSILESIVTKRIFNWEGALPVERMHSIRTAVVNGPFLAYCALMYEIEISHKSVHVGMGDMRQLSNKRARDSVSVKLQDEMEKLSLSSFLRVAPDSTLHDALDVTRERFHRWSPAITAKLEDGVQYPWTELAAFNPGKLFSDIVESTVAAIAVDQGYVGNGANDPERDPCAVEGWLARLGILDHLDKLLRNSRYRAMHPKEQIGVLAVDRQVTYEYWVAAAGPNGMTVQSSSEDQTTTDDEASKIKDKPKPMEPIRVDYATKEGEPLHCYNLYVGARKICSATGLTKMEAETRVAERATDILREEKAKKQEAAEPHEQSDDDTFYDAEIDL